MLRSFVLILATTSASAGAPKPCTYIANCDYGHGSRDSAPATTKESCCSLCQAFPDCAAGVLSGNTCWFKTAADVAAGCQHSSKVQFACTNTNAPTPAPAPSCSDPACLALLNEYDTLKNTTCAKVVLQAPVPNAADIANFMKLYGAYQGQTGQDEAPLIAAATKILTNKKFTSFLTLPDSFTTKGGLDAAMVQCAVMSGATSIGLAEFAKVSDANKALITKLLADPILMRDMLVAGGAVFSENDKGNAGPQQYGAAMAIYEKLLTASPMLRTLVEKHQTVESTETAATLWDDRSQKTVMKRFALGLALEHAIPIHLHYHRKDCDESYDWCPTPPADENVTTVDPIARYMHYEAAYKAGELDPAFEVLTAFEAKHTCNSPASDEDLQWLRTSMGIYNPDHIAGESYHWKYAKAVSSDVAYGDPMCAKWGPYYNDICNGHYASIPASDGVCGPRAFFGRFTRLAFGLPTWGATQPGHAAMTTWSPDEGWHVLLGAAWPSCWWGARSGPDFYLEAQARELRASYQQIFRATWVSIAAGETPAGKNWDREGSASGYGKGGPWAALAFYAKKIAVKSAPAVPRVVGPAVVPNKVAAFTAAWPAKLPTPTITTTSALITIPAAAYSSKNKSCSLTTMKSNEAPYTTQQVKHSGCASSVGPPCAEPTASSWQYTVTVGAAATYFLTANFTTWHPDQDLYVTVNEGDEQTVPVYYTVGWWNQTQPLHVALLKGANTLSFYRSTTRPLVFKAFYLYKTMPHIPLPPANYTPTPAPKYPNASQYIEVPAATTCVKQGITPVPSEDCARACQALGFKGTGPRARPNISGCFVLTEGQYAGNCNYNSNTSATCTPPCTLYGSIVRSICLRA